MNPSKSHVDCLFIVQGEGRGHLTQALAARQMLVRAGHRVTRVLVGGPRALPAFFREQIDAPITRIASPGFAPDARRRGVRMGASVWDALRQVPDLRRSLDAIEAQLERHRPDVVVNFFEPMAGGYWGLRRPAVPMVAVAHQYLFDHHAYRFPAGHWGRRWATRAFTRLTAWGAAKRLALSLYPAPDRPDESLHVLPPLLRSALFDLPTRTEPFLLVYVLNSGYAEDVIRWHRRHPEVPLHCFWDRPDADPVERIDDTLTFHRLDGAKFLRLMARARGVVTTAGFESVAEAMVLGKPVQAIPVDGHFEQWCNAHDAVRARAGIWSDTFDLSRLIKALPAYEPPGADFRSWVQGGAERFVRWVEAAAGSAGAAMQRPRHAGAAVPDQLEATAGSISSG